MGDLSNDQQKQIALGKQLDAFIKLGYTSHKSTLWWTFIKGVATGFGILVGSTVGVVLLLWVLSLLNSIPLIGDLSTLIREAINNR
jgi:hypothetical protein